MTTERRRPRSTGQSVLQAAKSDAMRIHVLETTITCLAARPYSEVSVAVIAAEAGVSRGGMQYHFATRTALLGATVEHLHARRLALFRADIVARPAEIDIFDHIVEAHWHHLNEREFRAYQEIVLAARSEPGLAEILGPSYERFLTSWHKTAREMFGWDYQSSVISQAEHVAHYLLEGMAFGQLGGQLTEAAINSLLTYVKDVLRSAAAANKVQV
jgi:AcrR family transcriptional regulator